MGRKPHPKTGEKRKTRRPFAIDAMPEAARVEIQRRRAAGQTWQEISEASPGFTGTRDSPPKLLSISVLQRWYDVRVEQVQAEVLAQSERARVIAASFAGKGFDKLPQAVQSGLSSAIFSLAESSAESDRGKFLKGLNDLAWLLASQRRLDQEEKRLALESRKIEAIAAKVQGLKKDVGKKKLSSADLAKKLDEIYDIAS